MRKQVIFLSAVALVLLGTGQAQAGDLDLGVGLIGSLGGTFLNKPSDKTLTLPTGQSYQTDDYPGFGGFVTGGGLMLEARYLGIIGLEVDVIRSNDRGKGDITFNNVYKVTVDIGQTAWHVPMLAKATIPLPLLRPSIFVGPEYVMVGDSSVKLSPDIVATQVTASADNYWMVTAGLGLELKLPLPVVDLRIPFSIRGSYAPSVGDKLADRVSRTYSGNAVTSEDFRSVWKYQTQATIGAALYF